MVGAGLFVLDSSRRQMLMFFSFSSLGALYIATAIAVGWRYQVSVTALLPTLSISYIPKEGFP
jgi:hypothetical protein